MRLFHHPMSSNARRAVMTALHLEMPVELVLVDLAKGEQRRPEYLKLNANGRVPVLDDDGFHLHESHAVMQYLADKAPKQDVYPTDVQARADVNRWLFWNAQHLQPAAGVLNWERFVKQFSGGGAPDAKEVERGERLFGECARVLDGHLADGRAWITGASLTLADLAIAATLMSEHSAKLPLAGHEHVKRWYSRVQELPAWKKTTPQMPPAKA